MFDNNESPFDWIVRCGLHGAVQDTNHPAGRVFSKQTPSHLLSRGICSVSFSSASLLAALSLEEVRSLFIFDFKAAALLFSVKVGQVDAGQVLFNASLFSATSCCYTLATFGGERAGWVYLLWVSNQCTEVAVSVCISGGRVVFNSLTRFDMNPSVRWPCIAITLHCIACESNE